jgi:hypothetical protein
MWLDVAILRDTTTRITEIKRILKEELSPAIVLNIQYLVKVKCQIFSADFSNEFFTPTMQ